MVQMFSVPSEYERAAAEARRRRRMAELLASQEYDPSTVQNAPIPAAAPLVQGLQAFIKGRLGRQAEEALERAEAADVEEFENLYKSIRPQERAAIGPDAFADPMEMASKYTAPRMETYTPSEEERRTLLERSVFGKGSPRAKRYAETLLAQMDKEPEAKVMAFGDQLLNVTGGTATPITMGGQPLRAAPTASERTSLAKLIAERDALPLNSPLRATYDAAIAKETTRPSAPVTNVYSTTAVAGVDEQGNPIFFQPSKSGGQPSIIEGVRPAPKGMNESQAKAAGFADRLTEASPVFESGPVGLEASVLSDLPFGAGNFALTPQQQSFLQAERNFINAVLRRESGAVISQEEFRNARQQYIPQPGDSRQVLEQKKRNRETVRKSLVRDAGPSYKPTAPSAIANSGWGEAEVVQ